MVSSRDMGLWGWWCPWVLLIRCAFNVAAVSLQCRTLKMHAPMTASSTRSSGFGASQNPGCRGCERVTTILRVCLDAWPARTLAMPTPTRPMVGPSTGVAHEIFSTKPTSCRTAGRERGGRALHEYVPSRTAACAVPQVTL